MFEHTMSLYVSSGWRVILRASLPLAAAEKSKGKYVKLIASKSTTNNS